MLEKIAAQTKYNLSSTCRRMKITQRPRYNTGRPVYDEAYPAFWSNQGPFPQGGGPRRGGPQQGDHAQQQQQPAGGGGGFGQRRRQPLPPEFYYIDRWNDLSHEDER